jgi:hypothetical protein
VTEPPPPQNIALFVEVLGLEGTLMLIEKRGGTQFWVPIGLRNSSAKVRDDLEVEFGAATVRALIETFGGGQITVPLCPEWRTALYAARGLSRVEIARRLCCHVKTVERRLKRREVPAQDRQSAWHF